MKTTLVESFHPDEGRYSIGCMLCFKKLEWDYFTNDKVEYIHKIYKHCCCCGSEVVDFETVQDVDKVIDNMREALEKKWTIV